MEIAFARLLKNDTTLLQEIIKNMPADRVALKIEMNVHVFAESGRIVVSHSLCVSKSLQDGIRLQ